MLNYLVKVMPFLAGIIKAFKGNDADKELLNRLNDKVEKLEFEVARLSGFVDAHHGLPEHGDPE